MTRHRGFRTAVQNSLLERRIAGVSATELSRAAIDGSPAAQLVPVLTAYEYVLEKDGVVDPAGVFRLALESFDAEAPMVLDGVTLLVPTLSTRGVTGELVRKLLDAARDWVRQTGCTLRGAAARSDCAGRNRCSRTRGAAVNRGVARLG